MGTNIYFRKHYLNLFRMMIPYGFSSGYFKIDIKKFLKNLLPTGIVELVKRCSGSKKYSIDYLKKNTVSDLTENEKWLLLSILTYLEHKKNDVHYLEVGVYAGGTIKFLKSDTISPVFSGIDLFEDFIPSGSNTHFWKNYTIDQVWGALGKERVTLYKGDSVDVLKSLQNNSKQYDLIFIDGNHTYKATKADFEAALPLLKNGGYIAFHNCSSGITQEDRYYIDLDGGPWRLTIDLLDDNRFTLIEKADRLKVFKYDF